MKCSVVAIHRDGLTLVDMFETSERLARFGVCILNNFGSEKDGANVATVLFQSSPALRMIDFLSNWCIVVNIYFQNYRLDLL